tara:strand:+ start:60 stop:392 length:333 start_codon:yes stop_codon:yes gene_type:complete
MGQFSWIAQDTKNSISSCNPKPITMVDNKGNKWTETYYEGYGIFNGKDFYQLLAEMNNVEGLNGDVDNDRIIGIDLFFGDSPFISPNLNENSNIEWENKVPEDCPDQGWT